MFKSILASTVILLASVPSAFAGPPARINAISVLYGQTTCMQRAKNQLFVMGATNISANNVGIWGHIGDTILGVWCRNKEVLVMSAGGDNIDNLKDELIAVF